MTVKKLLREALNERITATVSKAEVQDVITKLEAGVSFSNNDFQFVKRPDGVMLRYDLKRGTYKFYNNLIEFAKAIVRFVKRGW